MTGSKLGVSYTDKGERHEQGSLNNFAHLTFWVGNAKQAAEWYCLRFGFEEVFYRGLETGERETVSHVIQLNQITFEFQSPLAHTVVRFGTSSLAGLMSGTIQPAKLPRLIIDLALPASFLLIANLCNSLALMYSGITICYGVCKC